MHWVQWCSLKWHTTAHFYTYCFHSIFTSVLFLGTKLRNFQPTYCCKACSNSFNLSWLSGVSPVCLPIQPFAVLFNSCWDACTRRVCSLVCFLSSLPKTLNITYNRWTTGVCLKCSLVNCAMVQEDTAFAWIKVALCLPYQAMYLLGTWINVHYVYIANRQWNELNCRVTHNSLYIL